MGFYRPINFSGGGGRGVSSDGADGANKVMENVYTYNNMLDDPGAGKQAAKMFTDALKGMAGGFGSAGNLDKVLPRLELSTGPKAMGLASTSVGFDRATGQTPGTPAVNHAIAQAPAPGVFDRAATTGTDGMTAGPDGSALKGLDAGAMPGADIGSGLSNVMHHFADMASKLADPTGILGAIFEFFKTLFSSMENVGQQMADSAMQQIHTYNQAAEAALDTAKEAQ